MACAPFASHIERCSDRDKYPPRLGRSLSRADPYWPDIIPLGGRPDLAEYARPQAPAQGPWRGAGPPDQFVRPPLWSRPQNILQGCSADAAGRFMHMNAAGDVLALSRCAIIRSLDLLVPLVTLCWCMCEVCGALLYHLDSATWFSSKIQHLGNASCVHLSAGIRIRPTGMWHASGCGLPKLLSM